MLFIVIYHNNTLISSSFLLTTKGPPKIISPLVQHAIEGQPAQVECFVYSAPLQSNVVWAYNSQVIVSFLATKHTFWFY